MPGTHVSIMPAEVLQCLRPGPGDVAVDCTLGSGSHALAILERIQPGGRLFGIDVDRVELSRAEERLRAAGFGPDTFIARHGSFAELPRLLAGEGTATADVILADLGVSSMQHDDPARGFSYKTVGPLDMRMDQSRGEAASALLARLDEAALTSLLRDNADEPYAELIAHLLKRATPSTTHTLERVVRTAVNQAHPELGKSQVKTSVRRVFQALRIAVNGELAALDGLLGSLPALLAPAGRVAILTFHSGEDRRVKKAFQAGQRDGTYSAISRQVVRSTKVETFSNRRAAAAKLRWAIRTWR